MNSIVIKLLVSLLTIFTCSNEYDNICPHSSQWNLTSRSYRCVDQKTYLCLFDLSESHRTNKTVFRGACGHEDVSREGTKYILNPNLEQVPCDAIQYQPFTFTTNGNSQCALGKSLCKSSGQILASNENTFADASCRCDYTRGFDYIIPPKDPCSCKPTEEDCSCYIRKCDDDKVMIADYRCVTRVETILPEDIKCPIISRTIPPEDTDAVDKKQFKSILSSRTWSKKASDILIVVVIMFTVLVGFIFFSVPHVTSILLTSEHELSVKNKVNEFMILNGDNVEIKCSVKSYIPVRSVTWQKEINGEIIQMTPSEDKLKKKFRKRICLTINNFNAEDQGKYRCIVRNAIGLSNELFSSCMNHMSSVGWLTRFVTVLQHIPAFFTEDIMYMSLHTYDIDSQSKPTVYNVHKGDAIKMIQYADDQQKLIAVKWFKKSDKWTEVLLSNEQLSGGVPDVPSLTIKTTSIEDAGKYSCFLVYDNGKRQSSLFKLKIIRHIKIYEAVCQHRKDKTFIRPEICDTIDQHLQENTLVVITGREGTGKSKLCLEFASIYEDKDYGIVKVDLSEKNMTCTYIADTFLIIDDQQYSQDSLNAFMEHHSEALSNGNTKLILTCRNLDLEIVKKVPEISKLREHALFIDINNCLKPNEKEKMISKYLEVHNIATSSSISNFRDPIILNDLSVPVKLDEDVINIIKKEEPWTGFPLSLSLFCSDRKCLHLGEKYFTNPPKLLLNELTLLYETARKDLHNDENIHTINEYCALVYILTNSNHQLIINDNICSEFDILYQKIFHYKHEKLGSNDQKRAIEETLHRMKNKYLKLDKDVYEFIHPCLIKAMFLSSHSMVDYLLNNGALHDITEFVRSNDYTGLENELFIKVDEDHHHILCERLVRHAFESQSLLRHIAQYIYTYWSSSRIGLVYKILSYIECKLFQSLGVQLASFQPRANDSVSKKSIKGEDQVSFSNIIMLVDELSYTGRDPWIYQADTPDFVILSGLVTAAMHCYATNDNTSIDRLVLEFKKRVHSESFVKLLSIPIDIYKNTIFHYLMGLSQKKVSQILSVISEKKYIFDTENAKKYSPLDIAAYLGKKNVFKVLNLKTSNCTNKLRVRLKILAKSGKFEYYNEYSQNNNIDQPMVHKTKDDSDSSAKLEYEDADDDRKEETNESKNKTSFFKRNFGYSKEEPKKKEIHHKEEVLCFEDFMINIIVQGEIKDYESIIELLSK